MDAPVFPLLDGKLLEGLFICTCSVPTKASEQPPDKQLWDGGGGSFRLEDKQRLGDRGSLTGSGSRGGISTGGLGRASQSSIPGTI